MVTLVHSWSLLFTHGTSCSLKFTYCHSCSLTVTHGHLWYIVMRIKIVIGSRTSLDFLDCHHALDNMNIYKSHANTYLPLQNAGTQLLSSCTSSALIQFSYCIYHRFVDFFDIALQISLSIQHNMAS